MDEEQLELWNFCKELDNIVSNTYYYSKEKYKSICEEIADEIWNENYKIIKDFYSRNPNKFVEDYLGIELKWYQKLLLEIIDKKTNLLWHIGRRM